MTLKMRFQICALYYLKQDVLLLEKFETFHKYWRNLFRRGEINLDDIFSVNIYNLQVIQEA